ncbi:hypothetical protein HanPSC8_Chr11g0470871 [Helianthus annuus]|nr:hypothetical protein HanPSC8_Chr11g0470871 [Helianthus annuus]
MPNSRIGEQIDTNSSNDRCYGGTVGRKRAAINEKQTGRGRNLGRKERRLMN